MSSLSTDHENERAFSYVIGLLSASSCDEQLLKLPSLYNGRGNNALGVVGVTRRLGLVVC